MKDQYNNCDDNINKDSSSQTGQKTTNKTRKYPIIEENWGEELQDPPESPTIPPPPPPIPPPVPPPPTQGCIVSPLLI